jgi:nicotinamidase-related amidase
MSFPYCLCVIDVQLGFESAAQVAPICAQAVQTAIDHGAFIAIAQYYRFGKTHPEITNILKGASPAQYGFCMANKNSKESSITRLLYDRNIQVMTIYVCGVNTGACVLNTVDSLSKAHPEKNINVLSNACADDTIAYHQYGLSQMEKNYHNVILDVYSLT